VCASTDSRLAQTDRAREEGPAALSTSAWEAAAPASAEPCSVACPQSWYPLGRPVGTTIYPGMQITSVAIWKLLPYFMRAPLSLNDVCCLVPAWFGCSATVALGALTAECTGTWSAGVSGE